jgi:hypothetical protein
MIDNLMGACRNVAAGALGVDASRVSVMLLHRPHEDKNYADQTIFFFFVRPGSLPSAVGKVGFDPAGAHYLDREFRVLQNLSTRLTGAARDSVPRPLFSGAVAGRRLAIQTALPGEKVSRWIAPAAKAGSRCDRFLEWAADWLAAVGLATRADGSGLIPVWTEEFTVKLDRTGRSRALLESAARDVWEGFGQGFPSVLAHGDFCGENILGNGNGGYSVIDWELCDEFSLPTYDLLDLSLWILFRSEGERDPFGALDRLLNGTDPLAGQLRRCLGRYADALEIPHPLLPPLLTLSWAGYCLKKFRFLEQDETGNFARARAGVRKILETEPRFLAGEVTA